MNYIQTLIVLLIVVIGLDVTGLLKLKRQWKARAISEVKFRVFSFYLYISILSIILMYLYPLMRGLPQLSGEKMRAYFTLFGIIFLIQIPKLLYQIFWLIEAIIRKICRDAIHCVSAKIKFISATGFVASAMLFFAVVYGMLWWKTDFKVTNQTLYFENLPKEFDGFRILQISDLHLGSFYKMQSVYKAVKLIEKQKADAIVFTGDLVNVNAYEALDYVSMFNELKAPYGKYAILGNHDMNDYRKMDNVKGGIENMKNIIILNKAMGFDILLNEHRFLIKGKDTIALMGVLNWGKPPFRQYGKLSEALKGAEKSKFKILLTHDPSHWDLEVLPKTDIDLTLAGHTHGFQFGINCCGIKWSPLEGTYKEWNGLYQNGKRYLYVNVGLGFIGIPARVGIRPEITVIELKRE